MSSSNPSSQQPSNLSALGEIIEKNKSRVSEDQMREAMKAAYPEALVQAIKEIVVTDAGTRFLNELTNLYLNRPFCPPGSAEGFGYWRDGQASVIRDIWAMAKIK